MFTDASSIIKSIKEIHAQHVDLMPDNPHVRDIQGGYSHWLYSSNINKMMQIAITLLDKRKNKLSIMPDVKSNITINFFFFT